MIIQRQEAGLIQSIQKWIFIYGRRKTGKTFLVQNFLSYDDYFFVKRDRTIISRKTNTDMNYETFQELLVRLLAENKTVVIDEFQRLGEGFRDFLHFTKKTGKVILISSTFHLARKLLASNSPLLGLFAELPLGLIKIEDVLAALPVPSSKERLELAILLSEPFMIDYYKPSMGPHDVCTSFFLTGKYLVPALVGEVFNEEERTLSGVYEGILRAIACGKAVSTEISSFLYSRTLIPKDNPGSMQPYLANLMKFGLIKRVSVENKSSYRYENTSPLVDMFYYADEKYNLSEQEPSSKVLTLIYAELMPRLVERTIRAFLARKLGLLEATQSYSDFDVDAYLMRFKKGAVAVEIKWKKIIPHADFKRAEEVLSKLSVKRRLFFVPDKRTVKFSSAIMEIVDISDFLGK